jgi:hypothetical protein
MVKSKTLNLDYIFFSLALPHKLKCLKESMLCKFFAELPFTKQRTWFWLTCLSVTRIALYILARFFYYFRCSVGGYTWTAKEDICWVQTRKKFWEIILHKRSPTDCPRLRNWSETKFHGYPMLQKWKQQEIIIIINNINLHKQICRITCLFAFYLSNNIHIYNSVRINSFCYLMTPLVSRLYRVGIRICVLFSSVKSYLLRGYKTKIICYTTRHYC